MNDPIVSHNGGNGHADPEIAEAIPIYQRGGIVAFRERALVGWIHQNDTARDRRSGKVWGWVSEHGTAFQVYDEHFNRSERAGQVRFCGVANFTMIRMFHPYWARNGQPPRDMRPADKRWCRDQYRRLMQRHKAAQRAAAGDETDDSDDSDNERRKRKRAPSQSTGRKEATVTKQQKVTRQATPKRHMGNSSSSEPEIWTFPDDSSDSDSDLSDHPLFFRKKRRQEKVIEISDDESDPGPPKRQKRLPADSSADEIDSFSRSSQKQEPESSGDEGNDDSATQQSPRELSRSSETPLKQEAQKTQAAATGDTEMFGGVVIEVLPEWNFEDGESIDLDPEDESIGLHVQSNADEGNDVRGESSSDQVGEDAIKDENLDMEHEMSGGGEDDMIESVKDSNDDRGNKPPADED